MADDDTRTGDEGRPHEVGADEPRAGTAAPPSTTAAALFDLRSVIALLFLVYGLVLTVLGLVGTTEAELAKAGGIDINLWTGIAMLVIAVLFGLWVWLRPPLVGTPSAAAEERPAGH